MATILLVEDNDDVREMMSVALELGGHRVKAAANGQDALALLRDEPPPSLILLDLMMPVMNGWELRRTLARDPRLSNIPVIVISAVNADTSAGLQGTQVVPKPVDIDQLLTMVNGQCGLSVPVRTERSSGRRASRP